MSKNRVLTDEQVREIQQKHEDDKKTINELSAEYGVSRNVIVRAFAMRLDDSDKTERQTLDAQDLKDKSYRITNEPLSIFLDHWLFQFVDENIALTKGYLARGISSTLFNEVIFNCLKYELLPIPEKLRPTPWEDSEEGLELSSIVTPFMLKVHARGIRNWSQANSHMAPVEYQRNSGICVYTEQKTSIYTQWRFTPKFMALYNEAIVTKKLDLPLLHNWVEATATNKKIGDYSHLSTKPQDVAEQVIKELADSPAHRKHTEETLRRRLRIARRLLNTKEEAIKKLQEEIYQLENSKGSLETEIVQIEEALGNLGVIAEEEKLLEE